VLNTITTVVPYYRGTVKRIKRSVKSFFAAYATRPLAALSSNVSRARRTNQPNGVRALSTRTHYTRPFRGFVFVFYPLMPDEFRSYRFIFYPTVFASIFIATPPRMYRSRFVTYDFRLINPLLPSPSAPPPGEWRRESGSNYRSTILYRLLRTRNTRPTYLNNGLYSSPAHERTDGPIISNDSDRPGGQEKRKDIGMKRSNELAADRDDRVKVRARRQFYSAPIRKLSLLR